MLTISYGGYSFPDPLPFLGIEESQVFASGQYDHSSLNITLIGNFTGCDFNTLNDKKVELENALSSGFQTLTVGSTGYDYAKPVSIRFEDSVVNKMLPYEISFEAYHQKDFSQFYGIENPVDSWQYQEQDGRRVAATHTVSAVGKKVSATDSLTAAKNFVNSRLNDFENISVFFSGDSVIKTSTSESIDRISNSYGITENYILSESHRGFDSGAYIVRPDCSISYSEDSLSVSVNGRIEGGITGSINESHTGLFTPAQAKAFAIESTNRAKVPLELDLYGEVFREPRTFNYEIDSGANVIGFSFSFSDPTSLRTGEVLHTYSTDFSASKDNGFVTASINGNLVYDSTNDIFSTTSPETEQRFQKVEAEFSGVNPFAILNEHYGYFTGISGNPYSKEPLSDLFQSFNISKSPFNSSISYDYQYSNQKDLTSGILRNASISIQTEHPIPTYSAQPTLDGSFSVQETFDTLMKRTISMGGTLNSGYSPNDAIDYFNFYVGQHSGQNSVMSTDSVNTGNSNVQLSKSFIIKNE